MAETPTIIRDEVSETKIEHPPEARTQGNPLASLIASLAERTKTSRLTAERTRRVLADPRAATGFHPLVKKIFYPLILTRSAGSKIWDVDGNEYTDFTMGFGSNLFGHSPAFIKEALAEQLEKGVHLGQQPEHADEVAKLFTELTGHQRVVFYNSGTEAVMTALRVARAATGRQKIALFSGSYHGHFDGTLVAPHATGDGWDALPRDRGVTPNFVENVLVLEYGEPRSLEMIAEHRNRLAAVLVEPVQSSHLALQPGDFLKELKALTEQSGTVLIFDEMVTGFRVALQGAQGWFGVKADMATYGKIVGGGMPIGAVAGKADYIDLIDGGNWSDGDDSYPRAQTTFTAGTFSRHPLAMTAARAVLRHLKAQGPELQQRLNSRTANLVETLNHYLQENEVPLRLAHFGSLFGPEGGGGGAADAGGINPFYYYLLNQGVLINGGRGFLSTAHTDEDIDYFVRCVRGSVEAMRATGLLPPRGA